MNSSSPVPPVAFKNQCSILHNNILYVYSPDAFQVLELREGAQWTQQPNGVSATGAVCVKGGVDGDSSKPALYVVGGTTNSSTTNYTGVQRYSIQDKSWTTISTVTPVMSQRLHHGAAYLNASSALVVYGGSQTGYTGPSTETFLMLMYPPYRVQAYSSTTPPGLDPVILPWDSARAVMIGGSSTNKNIFLFHPDNGFQDLGLTLPNPLPDNSVAQSSLVTLDDNSKVLLTFRTDVSPNTVTRNVLLNPGNLPAVYGETAGDPTSSVARASVTGSRRRKRTTILSTYPAYNSSAALSTVRTNFALAQGSNELTALVGGDSSNSVGFYNKFGNNWVAASDLLGAQKPLTSSSSSSTTSLPTSSASSAPTRVASASPTPTATNSSQGSNSLAILGGVLGGVCGLAAILIILLLWLRNLRKKKQREAARKNKPAFTEQKASFESQNLQPLSKMGQPMGRSPVPSAVIEDRDSVAMFGGKINEKDFEADATKVRHNQGSNMNFGQNPFKRQQPSPLTISKPMLADLGDYQARPSIELGKATPVLPVIAASPLGASIAASPDETTRADQRKTDEGWAKYFSPGSEATPTSNKRDTAVTSTSDHTLESTPTTRRVISRGGGGGGFWPGSGLPEPSPRPPKTMRDSSGRTLTAQKVPAASPNLQTGPSNLETLNMSTAQGIPAQISSADSVTTDATDDLEDDEYEDERMIAYSSGVPSVHDTAWTPVGNTWSGPPQRPLRPPSVAVGAHDFPPATTMSNDSIVSDTSKSSIPAFPMPASTVRRVQPSRELPSSNTIKPSEYRISEDYFGRAPLPGPSIHLQATSTPQPQPPQNGSDMSWINLGTPRGQVPPAIQAPIELPGHPMEQKQEQESSPQPQ